MCVSTLKILNRSKVQIPGITPSYYNVPCGKCWQCTQAKRDSYLVRNFYEYLQTNFNHGWCLFLTLTYSDAFLPHVDSIPVFSRSDCQKYLKRFRINLVRYLDKRGFDGKSLVRNNIRYFLTCENGDRNHRPHYHILLYCNSSLISRWIGRKIACDSWHLGFAVPSSENYGFINSVSGIKYVTKYVGKSMTDDVYYNQVLAKYKQKYLDSFGNIKFDSKLLYERLEKNKPFLLSSKGLGLFGLSENCDSQYRLVSDSFYDNTCIIADSDKVFSYKPLPQYYKRKFCFDVESIKHDYDGKTYYQVIYKLNDFGRSIKNHQLQDRFDNFDKNVDLSLGSPLNVADFMSDVTKTYGKGITYDYVLDLFNRNLHHPSFKSFALLYSAYVPYLSDDELNSHYHDLPFNMVVDFRNHVNFSDSSCSITLDNIDDYYDFYIQVLENIFYFRKKYPMFQRVLDLYDLYLFHVNKFKTDIEYSKQVTQQSHKIVST